MPKRRNKGRGRKERNLQSPDNQQRFERGADGVQQDGGGWGLGAVGGGALGAAALASSLVGSASGDGVCTHIFEGQDLSDGNHVLQLLRRCADLVYDIFKRGKNITENAEDLSLELESGDGSGFWESLKELTTGFDPTTISTTLYNNLTSAVTGNLTTDGLGNSTIVPGNGTVSTHLNPEQVASPGGGGDLTGSLGLVAGIGAGAAAVGLGLSLYLLRGGRKSGGNGDEQGQELQEVLTKDGGSNHDDNGDKKTSVRKNLRYDKGKNDKNQGNSGNYEQLKLVR